MLPITIILFVFCLLVFIYQNFQKPKNFPPGPPFIPIIGNYQLVKNLSKKLGGRNFAFSKLARDFKTNVLGLKIGSELIVVTFTYDTVKEVLTSDDFIGRPNNFFMNLRNMGTRKGITGVDGDLWKCQRTFVMRHLKNLMILKENTSMPINNECANLIKILATNSDVQFRDLLTPFLINIFWNIICGKDFLGKDPRSQKILKLLRKRNSAFDMTGGILNAFPWIRFFAPKRSGYCLIERMNNELKQFMKGIVMEHYDTWFTDKEDDLIYVFLKEIKDQRDTFTDDQLVMVLLDLFIASSQTTTSVLDFSIMMMIVRPDIQEKLQRHLDDSFDRKEPIRYSDKDSVSYVEAFLSEVSRYFVITPIIGPRRALYDTKIQGYRIPKDTTILMSVESVHHDQSYWKDPEVFRPERFLDDFGNYIQRDYYLPFGLGKRRCLGDFLAKKIIFTFFSEIVRTFKISKRPESECPKMTPQQGIVVTPQPYHPQFDRRY